MMTERHELIIRIIVLVIIASLCISIFYRSKNLSCDKCIIKFTNYKRGTDEGSGKNRMFSEFNASVKEMNKALLQGYCLVIKTKNEGYTYGIRADK